MSWQLPQQLIDLLKASNHITVLTGSGISAESGIPTFRDAQSGIWSHYDPQELATPQAFQENPRLVWEWYTRRRELIAWAQPNPGHMGLVELARMIPRFTLITQNVDRLHQIAGSQDGVELHGNIRRSKCSKDGMIVDTWQETGELPPRCTVCGHYLRPDVVWFGEAHPAEALAYAWEAAQSCDVFISIGTSGVVEPAASLPHISRASGATLVEINPNPTPLTHHAAYTLFGLAGEILPDLAAGLRLA